MAAFIADVVAATGGTEDAGGERGITDGQIDGFLADAAAYLEWQDRAGEASADTPTELMPFGPATPELYDLYARHAGKVGRYCINVS